MYPMGKLENSKATHLQLHAEPVKADSDNITQSPGSQSWTNQKTITKQASQDLLSITSSLPAYLSHQKRVAKAHTHLHGFAQLPYGSCAGRACIRRAGAANRKPGCTYVHHLLATRWLKPSAAHGAGVTWLTDAGLSPRRSWVQACPPTLFCQSRSAGKEQARLHLPSFSKVMFKKRDQETKQALKNYFSSL